MGVESTVVSLAGPIPVLLRPGGVTKEQLEDALGCARCKWLDAVLHGLREGETAASPGMKYKHYAPKAEVTLVKGSFCAYCNYVAVHAGPGVFALCYEGEEAALCVPAVAIWPEGGAQPARRMHCLQPCASWTARGACTVYARCPREDGVALAVYNRICCAQRRFGWWRY